MLLFLILPAFPLLTSWPGPGWLAVATLFGRFPVGQRVLKRRGGLAGSFRPLEFLNAVSDQGEADHQKGDGETGEGCRPPGVHHDSMALTDQETPCWSRRRHSKAQVGEGCFCEYEIAQPKGDILSQRASDFGQEMP